MYPLESGRKHEWPAGSRIRVSLRTEAYNPSEGAMLAELSKLAKPVRIDRQSHLGPSFVQHIQLVGAEGRSVVFFLPGMVHLDRDQAAAVSMKLFNFLLQKHGLINEYFVSEFMYNTTPETNDNYETNNTILARLAGIADDKIPKEFFCNLSDQIMNQPVFLPEQKVWVDKIAFLRAFSRSGGRNPYTGTQYTTGSPEGMLKIDEPHLEKIRSFLRENASSQKAELSASVKLSLLAKTQPFLVEATSSNKNNRWYGLKLGLFGEPFAYCRIHDRKFETAKAITVALDKQGIFASIMFDRLKDRMPIVVVPEPKKALGLK